MYSAAFAALAVALVPVGLALSAPSHTPADSLSSASVELAPVRDVTLIEDDTGSLSNGAGQHFFSGRVGTTGGTTIRRGLIAFNASTIPSGARVDSVQH